MSLIIGIPNSPLNDLEINKAFLDECKSLNNNILTQIQFFTPYPGTPLTTQAKYLGYKEPTSLEEFGNHEYFLNTNRSVQTIPWYSEKEANDYRNRFKKLFPIYQEDNAWNWRDN